MTNNNSIWFKKHIISSILICFFITYSFSQDTASEPSEFWNNVQFGGGVSLSFGSGFFAGNLAPVGVYRFNEFAAAGLGINFGYTSEKNFYESFVVGPSVLGLINPLPQIQISSEFQQSYVNRTFDDRTEFIDEKYWVPALFLGIGYTTNNITVGIQYDVLYDRNYSIYNDSWYPFVRILF